MERVNSPQVPSFQPADEEELKIIAGMRSRLQERLIEIGEQWEQVTGGSEQPPAAGAAAPWESGASVGSAGADARQDEGGSSTAKADDGTLGLNGGTVIESAAAQKGREVRLQNSPDILAASTASASAAAAAAAAGTAATLGTPAPAPGVQHLACAYCGEETGGEVEKHLEQCYRKVSAGSSAM